MNNHSFFTDDT